MMMYADDLRCFAPSFNGLKDFVDVCSLHYVYSLFGRTFDRNFLSCLGVRPIR